jgi:TRAP-type C4-dicarboxylate transport system permease small subunit
MTFIKWLDKAILQALKVLTMACFVALTILVSANVVVRFVPVVSLHWFDEIIELLYAALVFYGAAALWITREHFSVGDWIGKRLAPHGFARHAHRLLIETLALGFAAVFLFYSFQLAVRVQGVTNVFAIPKWVLYACMPVGGAVMVLYSIRNIVQELFLIAGRPAGRKGVENP